MTEDRERLDVLVQRLAGVSRSKAQGLIQTGAVRDAEGNPITKPGTRMPSGAELVIADARKYVSRGGEKLEAALDEWAIDPSGRVAIDAGASTGGFTDCLLQRGARRVYAVDVGYGQLDWSLRNDARVTVLERTNIRHATPEMFDDTPDFFTADCSFISLRLVLPPLRTILAPGAQGVVLIKPQFEAGKDAVGSGGVVRDETVHEEVIATISQEAERLGYRWCAVMPSPLLGPAGNREFLAHLRWDQPAA
jgi:23S rRNA (cytidine1920-2'-O)/16S rRNA (cytidine1409-2'-O)-methyltransferase